MEHRLYNTGDQIWVEDGQSVKFITHDGIMWERGEEVNSRANKLYEIHEDGSQTWFGQRYGRRHVIKILSADGKVWSEEEPVVTSLIGFELMVCKITSFCARMILKVLA